MTTTTIIVYTSGRAAVTAACAAGWHRLDVDLSAWTLNSHRDDVPPAIATLVANLFGIEHGPPFWTNGARALLALEVLRTCEHDDPARMGAALDSVAAIVRAEIEATP